MENIDDIFRSALASFLNKRGSQRKLAADIGLDAPYLNQILRGTRSGSDNTRRKIASGLGFEGRKYEDFLNIGRALLAGHEPNQGPVLSPQGISEEELESYDFLRIPFRDDMRLFAGGGGAVPGTYDSEGSPVVIHRNAVSFRARPKDLVAFRVGGDSMEPILAEDGIVAVDTSQKDLRRLKEGSIYALCWDNDEEGAVKRLRWAIPGRLLAVESANADINPTVYLEPENRSVYLIGKVVWAWREFKD